MFTYYFLKVRIQEVSRSFGTPTYSPPFSPMLGCTLAKKMTSTMPMMNHSFRIVAKMPMLKRRGRPDHPAGSCQTAGQEFSNSPAAPPDDSLVTQQEQIKNSYFRTHGPRSTVKTVKNAQQNQSGQKAMRHTKMPLKKVDVLS